jgi:L-alanine-DL-glutamate epimerase-like enolase superfamily enzyme
MKIKSVETILASIPYEATGSARRVAGQASPGLNMLLVKVTTEDGIVGWGEAFGHAVAPATKTAIDTLLAPLLIGRDASDIGGRMGELQRKLHLFGRSGPVIYGLSGIDIALWDIAGKAAGLPLYRLLGGSRFDELTVYSSFLRSTGPEAVAASCREAVAQGFRHIKLHEIDVPTVRAAREAVGPDVEIMLDTNCPWSVSEAVDMAREMAPLRLYWLEEPVWPPDDHAGLARVRAAGAITSAGENADNLHDFQSLFNAGAVDVAQPSVAKVGGISEMRKIMALAQAHGVRVVPHCGYLGPGYLATLHLVASMPGGELVERLNMQLQARVFGEWTETPGARARVPQAPGLGCDPDMDVLERVRVQ